jgi:hypothetical protein
MGVAVDEARDEEPVRRVEDLALIWNGCPGRDHRLDDAVSYEDVGRVAATRLAIDHATATYDEGTLHGEAPV